MSLPPDQPPHLPPNLPPGTPPHLPPDRSTGEPHRAGEPATPACTVLRLATTSLPTPWATFRCLAYRSMRDGMEHLVLALGDLAGDAPPPLVRVHSECLTGDVFGSGRCDCGEQLHLALARIADEGRGALLYLRGHEGRGIGLGEKMRAYRLQDDGFDTVDANTALGWPVDARDYDDAAAVLHDLGVTAVRLLTNNPAKEAALVAAGIDVLERVATQTEPKATNAGYLHTKQARLGHDLGLER